MNTTGDKSLPKITARTTRPQMIDAYNKALEKIEQLTAGGKIGSNAGAAMNIVDEASQYTPDAIVKGIANLQLDIGKTLNDLSASMSSEYNKLVNLRKAIDFEINRLKDLHTIDYTIQTLTALINAQSEQKEAFEKEMAESKNEFESEILAKRDEWKREQAEFEQSMKERDAQVKKIREREEDEYRYSLSIKHRKETDEFAQKLELMKRQWNEERMKSEKELEAREQELHAQETAITDLKKKVDSLPKELESAVKKAETELKAALQRQHEIDSKMLAQSTESEKKILQLTIKNLEDTISKLQTQNVELSKQLQTASKQVQELAIKAIENTSGIRATAGEIPAEPLKK